MTVTNAFSRGFSSSILARHCCANSTALTWPARKAIPAVCNGHFGTHDWGSTAASEESVIEGSISCGIPATRGRNAASSASSGGVSFS